MARPGLTDAEIARVLSHPMRPLILEFVLERGEASPNDVATALGSSLGVISYHVRVLRDDGWLELSRTEPRRGAVEHFYRVTTPPFVDDARWERLPVAVRRQLAGQTLGQLLRAASDAAVEGGFDEARAHISRFVLRLDDEGWDELASVLAGTLDEINRIQERSNARGGAPRRSQLAILHHELAGDDVSE